MEIKAEVNPVGSVLKHAGIQTFIEAMCGLWDQTKAVAPWWKFWNKGVSLVPVTNFLLKCLDDLIAYVDDVVEANGADKKATVLWAVGQIYDYIVKEAMPLWAKPFASSIRNYIINTLISSAIDWIVDKYRNGEWRKKPADEVTAQWVELHAQLFGVPGDHRPKL